MLRSTLAGIRTTSGAIASRWTDRNARVATDMPPLPKAAIASLRPRRMDRLIMALWIVVAALLAANLLLPDQLKVLSIELSSSLALPNVSPILDTAPEHGRDTIFTMGSV